MRLDLGHGLDLNFSRSNMKLAIPQVLNQIWSNCHEMKSKRFDWILSNKCSHRVWPWLWPWPWIFKVKFWNSPIWGIGGPIDNEQSGVIHDHDRDLFVTKMRCKELPDCDQGDFRCRRAVDSSCCWAPNYVFNSQCELQEAAHIWMYSILFYYYYTRRQM